MVLTLAGVVGLPLTNIEQPTSTKLTTVRDRIEFRRATKIQFLLKQNMKPLKSLFSPRSFLALPIVAFLGCLFCLVVHGELKAQEKSDSELETELMSELNEKLSAAIQWGEIEVKLSPMVAAKNAMGIPWSPKAARIKLSESDEGLSGRLAIGESEPVEMILQIDDAEGAGGDASWKIDLNRDSVFQENEIFELEATERKGKFWYQTPQVTISLKTTEGAASEEKATEEKATEEKATEEKATDETRPYALELWHVFDPFEPEKEPVVRWSRRGWHEGQVKLGDQTCTVVISDMNLDGSFSEADAWGIGTTPNKARTPRNSVYSVGKHAWFDTVAFQVTSVDEHGGTMKIRAVDVGVTQAEEKANADPYAKDRLVPRSEKPVVFLSDYEEALALAKKEDKRVVIDFVTTWCGPCKMMDRLVYSSQPIYEKSDDVIFLKLDGDDERELNKQYQIKAYPTVILLDSDGQEIRRRSGYQSVSKLLEFLK